ncbi:hypothetical protein [Microcystis sp. LE19-59.1C]|uniref:hypothetical protein n=1 Tax=Microcystis sp. LE19-59.1C TaxID=3016442 RepID=UPI0025836BD4|nr:hypothetical protein [Microcystis sp. LE19-59.1C]
MKSPIFIILSPLFPITPHPTPHTPLPHFPTSPLPHHPTPHTPHPTPHTQYLLTGN